MLRPYKSITLLALVVIISLLWGCSNEKEYNTTDEDINSSEIIEQTGVIDLEEENVETKIIVEEIIEKQLNAIRNNDIEAYIDTIDSTEPEYVAERKSWFRDIAINNIKNYHIEVASVALIDDNTILSQLRQRYSFNGKSYSLDYDLKFTKKNETWYDSGLNYNVKDTEHFQVKYPQELENEGKMAAEAAEEAYDNIVERIGIEAPNRTIIKIYSDKETLRQFVKLSFGWQFAGWYEYPESIKTAAYNSEDSYRNAIEHELTHKITISKGNNNLPYWFSEGLAMYFASYYNEDLKAKHKEDIQAIFSIEELEKLNLETMTDNAKVAYYYISSGMAVSFMEQEFGKDKLIEIIEALGKYSYMEGTIAEVDTLATDRFHETIINVLGVTVEELDNKFQSWINE